MTDILGRCLTRLVVNPAVGRGDAALAGELVEMTVPRGAGDLFGIPGKIAASMPSG
jgi:hypothetical protein